MTAIFLSALRNCCATFFRPPKDTDDDMQASELLFPCVGHHFYLVAFKIYLFIFFQFECDVFVHGYPLFFPQDAHLLQSVGLCLSTNLESFKTIISSNTFSAPQFFFSPLGSQGDKY